MRNKVLKRIVIFITVFMIIFSNCGYTIQALAATDGFALFGFNFFEKEKLNFEVYFFDESGKKQTKAISDVNSQMTMVLEIEPKEEGYLKSGTIKALSENGGNPNFKFDEVVIESEGGSGEVKLNSQKTVSKPANETLLKSEMTINTRKNDFVNRVKLLENTEVSNDSENIISEENTVANKIANIVDTNTVSDDNNKIVSTNVVDTEESLNNTVTNEVVIENTISNNNTVSENTISENVTSENTIEKDVVESEETEETEEELVDEESALIEEEEQEEKIFVGFASAKVESDDEIKIENVIEKIKVIVKVSFKTTENLNVEDLYKEIKVELTGNYINIDLEEEPVEFSKDINVGWTYTKIPEVSTEYTKVSPFRIGEVEGTIVENTITVRRDIEEEKYLPLKETKINLEIPNINGSLPSAVDVKGLKLKATRGEDINEVNFSSDNWEYDSNSNTLNILVKNDEGKFTKGEDIYVVTYRYDSYVEEAEISLETKGKVIVTEYSGEENKDIIKSLDKSEKVISNVGELVTYSISTTEERISKGKINANYNPVEELYEAEFETTVSINVLTNDVLKEFVLKDAKEYYMDGDGLEFETTDVKYKKVKLRYNEIREFLEKGGIIEIKNSNKELLYTIDNDTVKSEEDCEIKIENDIREIEICFKNISVNGNINVEFTKSIGKSEYLKPAFANFKKLESRIKATVKYSDESKEAELPEIKTEKEFEESRTKADFTMNKVSLSTTEVNQNVEFKIELNNDKEDSDMYVNPIFEIMLPKYVSDIDIKAVNMLYEAGLSIGNNTVYRAEDGTLRMRIEVNGLQTGFSSGTITNGTNIIINTNITLDKYAPRKDDQIKLYYINEGVTNYVSQTKWTINKNIPTGIIKTTNGFDSYVFKINTPTGFLTINEIENYDGQNSKVTSIKQGEETREIEMEKPAQVARMNLIAINNTENKCTDVVFLGRMPVKGVTDIKGEKLETNIDTTIVGKITENEENPLSSKIYYSTNANATKDLKDTANGWTEEVDDLSKVKSYLIIPDNAIEAGYTFKYTYEFIIPENLPYEAKIYGAFGGYYNNHADVAVNYETTEADKVGLITKSGPKVEAKLTVDIGDGAEIREAGFLNYTLKVINSGSMTAENITITNPIPEGTTLYEEVLNDGYSRYGWFDTGKQEDISWTIEKLESGEIKEFNYRVKVKRETERKDITKVKNKVKVNIQNLALDIESNEVVNNIKKSNFDIDIVSGNLKTINSDGLYIIQISTQNISKKDLDNVVLEYKLPQEVKYKSFECRFWNDEIDDDQNEKESEYEKVNCQENYDADTNVFTLNIPSFKKDCKIAITINANVISGNNELISNSVSFCTKDGEKEYSDKLYLEVLAAKLEASQVCSSINSTITEGEKVEFVFSISNVGNYKAKDINLYSLISQNLNEVKVETSGFINDSERITENNELNTTIYNLPQGESVNINISGVAKDVDDDNQTISSKMLIKNEYVPDIYTKEIILNVKNDPNRVIEQTQVSNDNEGNWIERKEESYTTIKEQDITTTMKQSISNQNLQNNDENQNMSNEEMQKYTISGKIWLDLNKNGILEDEEKGISGVQVQLQKDNKTYKTTVSVSDGAYDFVDIEPGKYVIIYSYNGELYTASIYKNFENGTERASYARELNNGQAITDTIIVDNNSINNINLGLQERDNFDLSIDKCITLAKVITNGKTTEHKYKNLDLAKLEISAKDLSKTQVELHYQITIKNEGNVLGKAIQIVDYLPKDTILNEEKSKGWYIGSDGNVYNDSLKESLIIPGETKKIELVLNKNMTTENTGVLGNKVGIVKTEGITDSIMEKQENNSATQELIISVRTGNTNSFVIDAVIIFVILTIIYCKKVLKIEFNLNNIKFKKIYK